MYTSGPSWLLYRARGGLLIQWNLCIVATPQDPTSWLLYRGGLLIQWNLCIVATPQDPTSWLLYRGDLLIQWNLCIYIVTTPQDPTSWLLYRGGLLIQWNLCIPQDPTSWLLYRGGLLIQWNLCIYSGHGCYIQRWPAAIQRWPTHTVEPVYSGHPTGPNQLAAIQRWPTHTVEPVYSGHPTGPNHIQRLPALTVEPGHLQDFSPSLLSYSKLSKKKKKEVQSLEDMRLIITASVVLAYIPRHHLISTMGLSPTYYSHEYSYGSLPSPSEGIREGGRREGMRGRREGNEERTDYRHNYIHGCGLNPLWKYLMQGVLCQFCR